jgi:hypothetical protein
MGCKNSTPAVSGDNPQDIFERACAFTWGDFTVHIDREIPALVLGIRLDDARGVEALVAPEAALELALKIVGAVERIRAEQEGRPPEGAR